MTGVQEHQVSKDFLYLSDISGDFSTDSLTSEFSETDENHYPHKEISLHKVSKSKGESYSEIETVHLTEFSLNQPSQQSIDYSFDDLRDNSRCSYRQFSVDIKTENPLFVPSSSLRTHYPTVSSLPSLESIIHTIYKKLEGSLQDSKKRFHEMELALHTPPRPKRHRFA